jgi:RHS repeat-associated protein
VVDDQGNLTARFDYSPWGELETVSGNFDLNFGFTGHFIHQPTGLYLAPFRAYDARLGRWLSRDPLGFADGPNVYAYVLNNPVNFWDSLGLFHAYVQSRPLVPGGNHSSIVVFPSNPSFVDGLLADHGFAPMLENMHGEKYLVISAFNSSDIPFFPGKLLPDPNRQTDSACNPRNQPVADLCLRRGVSEDDFIERLITGSHNVKKSELPYPWMGFWGRYNSNSFVTGIIGHSGARPNQLWGVMNSPLLSKPIPAKYFSGQ